ncbi:MAG: hypothetical protein ACR2JM_08770 [Mycobacterium sp.]
MSPSARPIVVAGIGGLVVGHILWLIGITLATRSASVSSLVLAVAALVVLGAVASGYWAWQRYQRKEFVWAAFLAALPIAPMIFTTVVLGVTYL